MYEETLVILKPDAQERKLAGLIIHRFEKNNLNILDIKYIKQAPKSLILQHYPDSMAMSIGLKAQKASPDIKDPLAQGQNVLTKLRQYLSRGPIIALRLGGENAIQTVRKITGYTDPSTAKKGTIRGDLGMDSIAKSTAENRVCENLVHASGNKEEAESELTLWFTQA